MKKNVGSADKIIRIAMGLGILGAGYYFECWLGLIGIIPIVTASINWCPLYSIFGIGTCKNKDQ
ncbi:MAG: DUF2892 domain-containing protein [Bacteroidales bacterium]|nr:DUF2892 domain-containing protein [Bacteroidales bacterium]